MSKPWKALINTGLVLVALAATGTVPAAEGRIPVFLPGTVIGADGKYIVTRNIINLGGGPAITIAAPNVDLDLNGFLISNAGVGAPVISVVAGSDQVTVRNGTLADGDVGVDQGGFIREITLADLKIRDMNGLGIHLFDAERGVILRNHFSSINGGPALLVDGGIVKSGTIADNVIRRTVEGIVVVNSSSLAVLNNRIEEITGIGILLDNASSGIVAENTVETTDGDGIAVFNGRTLKLLDNMVQGSRAHGIHLDRLTVNCLVIHNNSSGNGTAAFPGHGLWIEGDRNMIERNVLNSNSGAGLLFFSGAAGVGCANTFSGNTARGNVGIGLPVCVGAPALFPPNSCNAVPGCGVPNTTFGDNLIPGPPVF